LVLFRFPKEGSDAGKLVAQLITEPAGKASGPHHHQTEIQILTGRRHTPPQNLNHGDHIDVAIPGKGTVTKSISFERFVPKLSEVAANSNNASISGGPKGPPNAGFVRNEITVNRGIIRARSLVTWDSGGFPLSGSAGEQASQPAEVKFLGSTTHGYMANECVLEVLDADSAQISASDRELQGTHQSVRAPNPHTSNDTLEIVVSNYEFQRRKPVPWGMDFQWLFMAAGYGTVDLSGDELTRFKAFGAAYDRELFDEDRSTLLPLDPVGLPFPYLVGEPKAPLTALAEPDARPVCVPGDGE
jgi:hypothetical protein